MDPYDFRGMALKVMSNFPPGKNVFDWQHSKVHITILQGRTQCTTYICSIIFKIRNTNQYIHRACITIKLKQFKKGDSSQNK